MEQIRSYRRRGTPDLPMAVYLNDATVAGANPIPEYHPEVELVWVIAGHLVMQLGGESRTFREDEIFLIPGNTVHSFRFFSPEVRYASLIFSPDAIAMEGEHFFQKAFVTPLREERLQLPALLRPGHPAYTRVRGGFDDMLNAKIFTKDYQILRFSSLMAICTALQPYCTLTEGNGAPANPGNEAVRLCMRYIHNQLSQKITLGILGEYCHLHPNYLCALFKEYTGHTVFDYLTRYRVETAAQLLKNEELPISKVAELVGFRSESLFYRQFRQIMGVPPKAYAKKQKVQ